MSLPRIIIAHPGRQHSYRLASALKKSGMLAFYCTTIYDKPSSGMMKFIKRFLSADNLKRANNRKNPDLDDNEVIQFCEFSGMLEAFAARVDKSHRFYRFVQRCNADSFGKKVAKLAIKENVDAIILYDTNALKCFEYLQRKAPNIKRIMDISIAARPYMKKIYDEEIFTSGNTDLKENNSYLWDTIVMNRLKRELELTQCFLAASQFVKESLICSDIQEERIEIVPYGANVQGRCTVKAASENGKVNFLFVGQVNYRKGVPTLLDAFSKLDSTDADLTLTGSYNKNDWFVKENICKPNIHFTGLVTPDKMRSIYEAADVFVIDSFAEGMAQVGIEAMACGLPIICSTNSGVNDLVTNGENGFIIPCGDSEILAEKMQWFIDNRDKIVIMGEKAKTVAADYTWAKYELNVARTVTQILD